VSRAMHPAAFLAAPRDGRLVQRGLGSGSGSGPPLPPALRVMRGFFLAAFFGLGSSSSSSAAGPPPRFRDARRRDGEGLGSSK